VSSVRRGLAAAAAASLAGHLLAMVPWQQGGQPSPASPQAPTMVARLVQAPEASLAASLAAAAVSPPADAAVLPTADAAPAPVPAMPAPLRASMPAASAPEAVPVSAPVSTPMPPAAPVPAQVPAPAPSAEPPRVFVAEGSPSLDRSPQPLDDISPAVPAAAGQRGGTVVLRLLVSEHGVVESAVVVRSSPPGLFDEAALTAFRQARFSPGLRAGIPVRSEVTYEVEFAAHGGGTDSSSRTY
jgi:protein TonB